MKKLTLILAVLLTGCDDAYIVNTQLDMAAEHCANRDGVAYLKVAGTVKHSYADHREYNVAGVCNDFTEFALLKRVKK